MTVTVKVHAALRKFAEGGQAELKLDEGASARDAARALGIPEGHVGAVFVGSDRCELDTALTDGAELNFFAPLGGG